MSVFGAACRSAHSKDSRLLYGVQEDVRAEAKKVGRSETEVYTKTLKF